MTKPIFTIELKEVLFFAHHGLYEEERLVGNEFVVNLSATYEPEGKISKIKDTINYAELFEIVRTEMMQPRDLLESLAIAIAEKIEQRFPLAKEISIRIEKKNPSITNFSGSVSVIYKKGTSLA